MPGDAGLDGAGLDCAGLDCAGLDGAGLDGAGIVGAEGTDVPNEPRRWSWYLPLASSSRVRSSSIRYCSAALFTPTATIVKPLTFFSWHLRAVQ